MTHSAFGASLNFPIADHLTVARRHHDGPDLSEVIQMLHVLERMQSTLAEKVDNQTSFLKSLLTSPTRPTEHMPDGRSARAGKLHIDGESEDGEDGLKHSTPVSRNISNVGHHDSFVLDLFNAKSASKDVWALFDLRSSGTGCIKRFASSLWWMLLSAFVIILNTAFIGIEVQSETDFWLRRSSYQNGDYAVDPGQWDTTGFWPKIHIIFLAWMIFEVSVNAYAQRWDFIKGVDKGWNLFDVILICLDFVMQLDGSTSVVFLRVLRFFRLARILRMFRVIKFMRGIRNMLISMSGSFVSLMSAILIMSIFMYTVSLVMMQNVALMLESQSGRRLESAFNFNEEKHDEMEALNMFYGSIEKTMLTLFMSITGGIDWRNAAHPLAKESTWYAMVWVAYIAFMVLGMLNILTGIFCDAAMQSMNNDRDNVVATRIDENKSLIKGIHSLFTKIDADGSGFLSQDEFQALVSNVDMVAYLDAMGIDMAEVNYLWQLLDADGSGQICINECVAGFLRMKGPARAVDIVELLHENQEMMMQLNSILAEVRILSFQQRSAPSATNAAAAIIGATTTAKRGSVMWPTVKAAYI